MKTLRIIPSVVLTLVGVGFSIFSFNLGLGNIHAPGPGFVPFLAGGLLVVLSIATMVETQPETKVKHWSDLFGGERWRVVVGILGALFLYAVAMDFLGFNLSTFLILVFLFKLGEGQRWTIALGAALVTMVLTYLLFDCFLQVSFPRGFLGL